MDFSDFGKMMMVRMINLKYVVHYFQQTYQATAKHVTNCVFSP